MLDPVESELELSSEPLVEGDLALQPTISAKKTISTTSGSTGYNEVVVLQTVLHLRDRIM